MGKHFRRNCPLPDHGSECDYCLQKGHIAADCRKKKRNDLSTGFSTKKQGSIYSNIPQSAAPVNAILKAEQQVLIDLYNREVVSKEFSINVVALTVEQDPKSTIGAIKPLHYPKRWAQAEAHPSQDDKNAQAATQEGPVAIKVSSTHMVVSEQVPRETIDDTKPFSTTMSAAQDTTIILEQPSVPKTYHCEVLLEKPSSNKTWNTTQEHSDDHITISDTTLPTSDLHAIKGTPMLMAATQRGQSPKIILELCGGISGTSYALKAAKLEDFQVVSIENNPISRDIADHAHKKTDNFSGIARPFNDVFEITETYISSLPKDSITLVTAGPPCNDMSKLRLLPNTADFEGARKAQARDTNGHYLPAPHHARLGLKGKHGRVFIQCIKVIKWVLKHHPDAKYLVENVVFDDLVGDWDTVCNALGKPVIISHNDYSTTKRRRAYFTNDETLLEDPNKGQNNGTSIDPNTCMDPGRTLVSYLAAGRICFRPLSASYGGDPHNPVGMSNRRLRVQDEVCPGILQELRVSEAERLHGLPEGSTDGPTVTPLDRIRAIGAGWDNHVTKRLIQCLIGPRDDQGKPIYHTVPLSAQHKIKEMQSVPEQLSGRKRALEKIAKAIHRTQDPTKSMTTLITDPSQPITTTDLCTIISYLRNMGPSPINYTGSVIDSGAGRHVCSKVIITDSDSSQLLKGFDGTQAYTSGRGHKAIKAVTRSGEPFAHDIDDVDHFPTAAADLLSMGKLLTVGWTFNLNKADMYATLPGGERVTLQLSDDNLLILPHQEREGRASAHLPIQKGAMIGMVWGKDNDFPTYVLPEIMQASAIESTPNPYEVLSYGDDEDDYSGDSEGPSDTRADTRQIPDAEPGFFSDTDQAYIDIKEDCKRTSTMHKPMVSVSNLNQDVFHTPAANPGLR